MPTAYQVQRSTQIDMLRHLLNSVTWRVVRTEFDSTGQQTGRAVTTTIDAVPNPTNRAAERRSG